MKNIAYLMKYLKLHKINLFEDLIHKLSQNNEYYISKQNLEKLILEITIDNKI